MALSANTVWEVRDTGSDGNGGGFVAEASGTDRSQQAAAHATLTTLSTVHTTTEQINVSTTDYTVIAADVGNILQITGGTATAGFYRIIAADTVFNRWTVDRSVGTAGQTVVGAMGGALASIAKAAGAMVASNKVFVKGSFTSTVTTTLSVSVTPGSVTMPNRLIGYSTTRGDAGRAVLTLSTSTGLIGLDATGNGWWIENIEVDCANLGTSKGIRTVFYSVVRNCKVHRFTSVGIEPTSTSPITVVSANEITNGTSAASGAISVVGNVAVIGNYIHDNACTGIVAASGSNLMVVLNNVVTNNTGASSDGIQVWWACIVVGNTIHGNGRHGISSTSDNTLIGSYWQNNSISGNGGYGIEFALSSGNPADSNWDGNAFGYPANTSGSRNNMDNTTGINSVAPYTNVLDVTVTVGSQYINAAANDYDLNDIANQGALLRGAGLPETWPGNAATLSNRDLGASQHADPVGGGTRNVLIGG